MADRVFALGADQKLVELTRAGFVSEDVFQRILADHPAILGGPDGGTPLLIRREQPIPDNAESGGRWSLDHLYVDRSGVPVLVEVKRSTDTRLRREVVGQMLDYAANGVVYWRLDVLVDAFEETCRARGENAEQVLNEFLDSSVSIEAFWKTVEANLRAGHVRMVFVADHVPPELRRIVEFLNEQMRPAEVTAIQIAHFQGADGGRVLVPQIIGETERATAVKSVDGTRTPISTDEWIAKLAEAHGEDAASATRRLVEWHIAQGGDCGPTASQDALFFRVRGDDGRDAWAYFVRHGSGGRLEVALGYLQNRPLLRSDAARGEVVNRLRSVHDIDIRFSGKLTGYPSFPVSSLLSEVAWAGFTAFAKWLLDRARRVD
ncbi:MAG: hypothetical protein KF889_23685 [Alphaproteobacteria bacterium]|nr:hypothetical protein [Alphaproteobacteria bacterium]MCW5742830.1 hypothetical protein [Alphaproteobacteria bacterium]